MLLLSVGSAGASAGLVQIGALSLAPRGVLRDFGVELPADTEIRVWDSTAEVRYLVVPMQPKGTEGWSEQQLAAIVSRDCMIGTRLPDPGAAR